MSRAREFLRKGWTQMALFGVIFVLAATGIFRESTRPGEPEPSAENVARFYAAGETGLNIQVVEFRDVSQEIGAEEAYLFTLTAVGFEGEAGIVVSKTEDGGWLVIPMDQPEDK